MLSAIMASISGDKEDNLSVPCDSVVLGFVVIVLLGFTVRGFMANCFWVVPVKPLDPLGIQHGMF